MSRQYSRNSATRDAYPDAGYRSRYSDVRTEAEDSYEFTDEYTDADTGADHAYEYPADYHDELDRRWIWVAGVAGAILMVAVICTGVILGGGDSGSVSATQTSTSAPDTPAATTSAPVTAAAPAPLSPALPAETVTTVTPTPSATAAPTTAVETPVAPAAPPADPAAARTITYTVTGSRQMLDLVTIIYTDQQGALQTDVNAALPWSKTVALDPGVQLSSVTATSIGAQLNCAITDGTGAPLVTQTNNTIIATCTK